MSGPEARGRQVSRRTRQRVALEEKGEMMLDRCPPVLAQGVIIIPALRIERVAHERCTEDKTDLAFGHSRLELCEFMLCDHVSLRNADPVLGKAAAKQAANEEQQANDNYSHFGFLARCFTLPAS